MHQHSKYDQSGVITKQEPCTHSNVLDLFKHNLVPFHHLAGPGTGAPQ